MGSDEQKIVWIVPEIDERDDEDSELPRTWRWADMILVDRDYWMEEGDEILPRRSAMEFGWDQLTTEEQQKIREADTLWRDNPKAFNAFFVFEHRPSKRHRDKVLDGWVEDENGQHPSIPPSHWWWWPLDAPVTGSEVMNYRETVRYGGAVGR